MHNAASQPSSFRLAIAPGVPSPLFSALLAMQRTREPEVVIKLSEVSGDELMEGLREGRYDAGMSLRGSADPYFSSQPLWCESMAAALPPRFPLLGKTKLTISDLLDYPVFLWQAEVSPVLAQHMSAVLPEQQERIEYVTSFEMMALWVAAGYGVGVSAQSRIARAHAWDLTMRPLSDGLYQVITYLLRPTEQFNAAAERFEHRALQVARDGAA